MGSTMQSTMIILEWIRITTWSICLMRNLHIGRCPSSKGSYSLPIIGPHTLCGKRHIKTAGRTFPQYKLLTANFVFHALHIMRITNHFESSTTVCLCWIFPSLLSKSRRFASIKGNRCIVSACLSFILFIHIILRSKICIQKQGFKRLSY